MRRLSTEEEVKENCDVEKDCRFKRFCAHAESKEETDYCSLRRAILEKREAFKRLGIVE